MGIKNSNKFKILINNISSQRILKIIKVLFLGSFNDPLLIIKKINNKLFWYFYKIEKKKIVSKETEYLVKSYKQNIKRDICLYYDLTLSPKTIGDFIYSIFLSRSISLLKHSITIFVLCPEDFAEENSFNNYLINEMKTISDELLNNFDIKISFEEKKLIHQVLKKNNNKYTLFENKIINNEPSFIFIFDLINSISQFVPDKNFIIKNGNLNIQLPKILTKKSYISIGFRFNKSYGQERNITREKYLKILKEIEKYTKLPIVVVSDKNGCETFKKWFNSDVFKNKILYSKDYTNGFIEDYNIIINSKLFLQFRGGGTTIAPIFSDIPYLIHTQKTCHETRLTHSTLFKWSSENQYWIESISLEKFLDDFKYLQKKF